MTDAPVQSRYAFHADPKSLTWDYVRSILAFSFTLMIFQVTITFSVVWFIMLALLIGFGFYLVNTIWRHGLRLELDADGITAGWRNPLDASGVITHQKRRIPWNELSEVKVRYFSRKKDALASPWLMVRLEGGPEDARVKITFDGGHEGCKPVLIAARDAINRGNVWADEHTLANIEALGIETEGAAH